MSACVRASVRVCVRACVRACVRVCVRVCNVERSRTSKVSDSSHMLALHGEG